MRSDYWQRKKQLHFGTLFYSKEERHQAKRKGLERSAWLNTAAERNTAQVPRTPQATNRSRPEFKKVFERIRKGKVSKASDGRGAAHKRTGAVGRRRGTRPLHTQSPRGSMQEGKERAREGRHLLAAMLVTVDTSQRPMSWSNEPGE
jgi:hypothetical protein